MKAYTGEWVLFRMVWRERIGCAGVSREVKQDGTACTVVAECTAASLAGVKLSLVVRVVLERHVVKEGCCSCLEHVGPGDIVAQGGIEALAAACAATEGSLRPARWGWSPRAAPPSPRGGVGKRSKRSLDRPSFAGLSFLGAPSLSVYHRGASSWVTFVLFLLLTLCVKIVLDNTATN